MNPSGNWIPLSDTPPLPFTYPGKRSILKKIDRIPFVTPAYRMKMPEAFLYYKDILKVQNLLEDPVP
jgi:hypothetical protein